MIKLTNIIGKDIYFYSFIFVLWAIVIYAINSDYKYFGTPYPSAGIEPQKMDENNIKNSIIHIKTALDSEKDNIKIGFLFANLGVAYFELYKNSMNQNYLDSSFLCFKQAVEKNPNNPDIIFNAGLISLQKRDISLAQQYFNQYIKTEKDTFKLNTALNELKKYGIIIKKQ
jgi:tetratricopeptide (TPR) repeat protein